MEHRREIDGLRAVAVIPVIFFHAGQSLFAGGFLGVDIFFVISGYLITSILIEDSRRGDVSLRRFYERRVRRIVPMLYLVMALCAVGGWFLMLPDQLENLGQSIVATTLFSNNLLLAATTGYWDVSIALKPLVHSWSLGVEEQFYLLLPWLFLLVRSPAARRAWLAGVAVASLALALVLTRHIPLAAFYLSPLRFWEIATGALCAGRLRAQASVRSDILAALGLALIVVAMTGAAMARLVPLPLVWIVLAVGGTVLFLHAGSDRRGPGRLLAWPPIVLLGLISYSAYLWHQPVFAFARMISREPPLPATLSALVPAILALSYASWRWIERPCRDAERVGTRTLLWGVGAASLLLVGLGLALHFGRGFPARLFPRAPDGFSGSYIDYNRQAFRYRADRFVGDRPVRLLVVGNSFGRDIVNIVREGWGERRIAIVYRDDLDVCSFRDGDPAVRKLVSTANVLFFNGAGGRGQQACVSEGIAWAKRGGRQILFFGTKSFGTNINWLATVPRAHRTLLLNRPDPAVMRHEGLIVQRVPADHYVSLMRPIMIGGKVPFTDEQGRLLSGDTTHLTRAGARYLARYLRADPKLRRALG
ncbi:acyltransferase [Rhizorhabdus sp.]|uniref:acyltransferase family protein n=1 Tax=Rhizorhabdus sp. TaxID=1968843 RepID=UPI001B60B498|nr:acyltransferase [Rhizorhabdus sp.]MBP8233081.1 acyltransferase [Rhizorhabdus sp.]